MNLEFIPSKSVAEYLSRGWSVASQEDGDYAALMCAPEGWEQVTRSSDRGVSMLYRDASGRLLRLDGKPTHGRTKIKHHKCTMPGCAELHHGLGFCQKHYKRAKHRGHPRLVCRPGPAPHGKCDMPSCSNKSVAHGLCNKHYLRYRQAEKRMNELLEAA